jgi:cytochrome o ubiquinol oxidase subunit 3
MSTVSFTEASADAHTLRGLEDLGAGRDWGGPAPKRIVTGYGFWIFILSDIIMFSAFFASYAVLLGHTAGGPSGRDLFDLRSVAMETAFLLASSFTCGLASIAADARNTTWFHIAMAVTRSRHENLPASSRAAPGRPAARFCRRSLRWWAATACTFRRALCGC